MTEFFREIVSGAIPVEMYGFLSTRAISMDLAGWELWALLP